jgi:hypothetical protein
MELTSEMFFAMCALFFFAMWLLDDLFEWCYVRFGWEWCLHGGVMGELQKEDRQKYLDNKRRMSYRYYQD